MSSSIYVHGCFETDRLLSEEAIQAIKAVKGPDKTHTFDVEEANFSHEISFICEEYNSSDPFWDEVMDPLASLEKVLYEYGINLSGAIEVTGDCEYSISYDINSGSFRTDPLQVVQASTEDLIHELKKRGVLPADFEPEEDRSRE